MGKKIITISREFGSGGHVIGQLLAKKLGFKYYDKEIILKIAQETGLDAEFIEQRSEYASGKSFLSYALASRTDAGLAIDDVIYQAQVKAIKDIAAEGDCVIVGRCADYILKGEKDVLNVFIYGDEEAKMERVVEKDHKTPKEALALMKEMDKKRKLNYEYNTDAKWGDCNNYDVCLNSTSFGYEKCVDLIVGMLWMINYPEEKYSI